MDITLFSVSLRKDSHNSNLIGIVNELLQNKGKSTNLINLNDFQMPYFNQDILDQDGFPTAAEKLKMHFEQAKGLIISSPEYNYSMPGHFKNTIDWLARYRPLPFMYKPVLLLSASSSLGGLWALKMPLEALNAYVYPEMFSLAQAHESFTEDKKLKNKELEKRLIQVVSGYLNFLNALSN